MAITKIKTMPAGHTAGIFADVTLDGPEIGTLVAVVDRAKNLPNRKTMGKQDPYCAMRLGKEARKTETDRRGGQTPKWDQELRFTTHESPDYYKLKCSVFNDDKKTDLIGEGWIDLHDIIVPGGGQKDVWQQLNFKGKYAGEIRLELTYYDTRPKQEAMSENKARSHRHSVRSQQSEGTTVSKQLGPREIKKRPLPPSPAGIVAQASDATSQSTPPTRPPKEPFYPDTPDDFALITQSVQQSSSPQHVFDPQPSAQMTFSHAENSIPHDGYSSQHASHNNFNHTYSIGTDYIPTRRRISQNLQIQTSHPLPVENVSSQPSFPQNTLPFVQAPSFQMQDYSPVYERGLPLLPSASTSVPTQIDHYQDNQFRQLTNHTEPFDEQNRYSGFSDGYDEPPPPPPAHGNQFRSVLHNSPQQSYDIPPTKRHSMLPAPLIDDRSPLQQLEYKQYDYGHEPRPQASAIRQEQTRGVSYPPPSENKFPAAGHENQKQRESSLVPRRRSHNPYVLSEPEELEHSIVLADVPTPQEMTNRRFFEQERGRYPTSPPSRSATFDSMDVHDESYTFRSQPQVVKPRAVSPATPHSIPRKSLSPHPAAIGDRRSITAVPFSPDSYEIFNPGSSPVGTPHGQEGGSVAKESARQREVDKLRDQGPIIGNDGRVIDPTDHLPSDTWAPEPERKVRKPEHVIRVRTREEVRNRARASPIVNNNNRSAPVTPSKMGPAFNNVAMTPGSGANRHSLQQPLSNRPLPNQPYSQSQNTPVTSPISPPHGHQNMSSSRSSTQYSNGSGMIPRPPLAEYQIPETNSYTPRTSSYMPSWQSTPTKMQRDAPTYDVENSYGMRHSLADEMSMIDIGPRRGNRTATRSSQMQGSY